MEIDLLLFPGVLLPPVPGVLLPPENPAVPVPGAGTNPKPGREYFNAVVKKRQGQINYLKKVTNTETVAKQG
jgi:hypothetical protein